MAMSKSRVKKKTRTHRTLAKQPAAKVVAAAVRMDGGSRWNAVDGAMLETGTQATNPGEPEPKMNVLRVTL